MQYLYAYSCVFVCKVTKKIRIKKEELRIVSYLCSRKWKMNE